MSMGPKEITVSRQQVAGLTVRTKNSDEFNPETAKISGLWTTFLAGNIEDEITGRVPDSPVVAVYSNYESDMKGYYDVTAGVIVDKGNPDYNNVIIAAGKYLMFEAKGSMPSALIQAWGDVWRFFEKHQEIKRSYLSDFEQYCGAEEVQIHIGIIE
ncbi:GyrI-like domain-containing protein [Yersinia pekkanenii]|uniref:Bacterial transcription activator, effector binding domain n=1 Tax=Yersinia pekkanenii TaxID=1288385 RepID=A0A0T9PR01_9GAMM|nr:GyrI-like domain-containing protein [Yersinia pekkanenii]CNH77112.1 Bacterial transcription activator%2C effector binding domain [Yersinia pekkanenii]CRY68590.1 Bacterial transcription activator%2C effector binding domain [Yersinia pekkanenii]